MASDATWQTIAIPILTLLVGWLLASHRERHSQLRLFDHQIRLEKEYSLYCDLWDKLFELRRSLGNAVNDLGDSEIGQHDDNLNDLFNKYQAIVHRSEPFIHESILDRAKETEWIARCIIENEHKLTAINEQVTSFESQNAATPRFEKLQDENFESFERIEKLYREIATAVRDRVMTRHAWHHIRPFSSNLSH